MEVVFNELSFTKVSSANAANNCYKQFFEHYLAIDKLSLTDLLKIITIEEVDIFGKEIFNGISFRSWLEKLPLKFQVEKELIYKRLVDSEKAVNYPEYHYENGEAKGLGLAHENQLLTISFQTNKKWTEKEIEIIKVEINEKKNVLNESVVKVKHTAKKEHTINYKIWREVGFINENPKVIPKRHAQTKKLLFPQLNASNELVNGVEVENIAKVENWENFYKILVSEDTGVRIVVFELIFENLMEINGWVKNERLTKLNNRTVYEAGKLYAALDTQHGTIEIHNSKGIHKGEYRFDGEFEKNSTHTLKL